MPQIGFYNLLNVLHNFDSGMLFPMAENLLKICNLLSFSLIKSILEIEKLD